MTRTGPTTVNPNSTFTIIYTAISTGTWGASIQDSISGGCTFPSGQTTYQSVMLSEDGNTKSIIITAPNSGSCTFTGDYKFGTDPVTSFSSLTISVSGNGCNPNWQCTSWSNCSNNQQTRTCTDLNICNVSTNKPVETQTCSTQCVPSWSCNGWSNCVNNQQTRTCNDLNNCNNFTGKPSISQTCSNICTSNWHCSNWNSCSGGSKERTCTDLNNCGTNSGKPSESTDCSSSHHYTSGYATVINRNDNTDTNQPVKENPPIVTIQLSNPTGNNIVLKSPKTNSIIGAAIGISEYTNIFIIISIFIFLMFIILLLIYFLRK